MGFALLLLGLVPLAFLPDIFSDSQTETDEADTSQPAPMPPDGDFGDLLADPAVPIAPTIQDDVLDPDAQDPPAEIVLQPLPDAADNPDFAPENGTPVQPVDHMDPTNSTVRLDFEDVIATGYAEIDHFDPEVDILEVIIEQTSIDNGLDALVTPTADGEDARVYIEGQLFAILTGAPEATLDNLNIVIGDISG